MTEPVYVVAFSAADAMHFADSIGLPRNRVRHVRHERDLMGRTGITVEYVIREGLIFDADVHAAIQYAQHLIHTGRATMWSRP